MKRLIMDLDNTITLTEKGDYRNAKPITEVIEKRQNKENKNE